MHQGNSGKPRHVHYRNSIPTTIIVWTNTFIWQILWTHIITQHGFLWGKLGWVNIYVHAASGMNVYVHTIMVVWMNTFTNIYISCLDIYLAPWSISDIDKALWRGLWESVCGRPEVAFNLPTFCKWVPTSGQPHTDCRTTIVNSGDPGPAQFVIRSTHLGVTGLSRRTWFILYTNLAFIKALWNLLYLSLKWISFSYLTIDEVYIFTA